MSRLLAAAALAAACHHAAPAPAPSPGPAPSPPPIPVASAPKPVLHTPTIFGTSDTHGQVDRLAMLAGFVDNVRAARAADGGAVLLIDAGDLFQGTLESNLAEGAPVIARVQRDAATTRPRSATTSSTSGRSAPRSPCSTPGDDPRGALKARAAEAHFPILAANIIDGTTGKRVDWPNFQPTTIVHAAGATIGIVGVTTSATPVTTMPANFVGLASRRSGRQRSSSRRPRSAKAGATIVIVAAHLGGKCAKDGRPRRSVVVRSRSRRSMKVAPAIPKGLVDVIVAGHTHQSMAHRIAGIAVIESWNSVRAFGRVDLTVDAKGEVTDAKIFPPHEVCEKPTRRHRRAVLSPASTRAGRSCRSPRSRRSSSAAIEAASAKRAEPVGVDARDRDREELRRRVRRGQPVRGSDAGGEPGRRRRDDQRRRAARRSAGGPAHLRRAVHGDAVRQPVRPRRRCAARDLRALGHRQPRRVGRHRVVARRSPRSRAASTTSSRSPSTIASKRSPTIARSSSRPATSSPRAATARWASCTCPTARSR